MSERGKGTISFRRAFDCLIIRKLYIGEYKEEVQEFC